MAFQFHDVRFPESVSWGSRGGPEFRTQIFESHQGYEKRNIDWSQPQMRFNAAFGVRTDVQMQSVINFYTARQGMAHGFRFQNWANYKINNDLVALGDGVNKRLNLYKRYTAGNAIMYKRLYKIVVGSVTGITVDAVAKTEGVDFTIDYNSGEIIFTTVLIDNALVAAITLEFDEPVRFDFDDLQVVIDSYNNNSLSAIPMVGFRGTFTAGTAFEPGGSTQGADEFYSNTTLLLLFDDADGATTTTDFSAQALAVTFNGNAAVSRTAFEHGLGSLLPGTGSVSVAGTTMQMGHKPFTIEVFARKPATGADMQPIVSQWDEAGGQRGWTLRYDKAADQLQFVISYDGIAETVVMAYPWDPVDSTFFTYISVERLANGWWIMRIDGELLQSVRALLPLYASTSPVHVGTYTDSPAGTGAFQENIDSVRITTGRARLNTFKDTDIPLPYPIS